MKNLLKLIRHFVIGNQRSRVYEHLQWQRFLLRTGAAATAEVLDIMQEKSVLQEYMLIRLWVMLKVKGTISYQHVQTLLNKRDIPSVGQMINIRYLPDDM